MLSASSILNAMRKMRMSCAVALDFARCHARCAVLFVWSFASPSTFVEASEVGVVDMFTAERRSYGAACEGWLEGGDP